MAEKKRKVVADETKVVPNKKARLDIKKEMPEQVPNPRHVDWSSISVGTFHQWIVCNTEDRIYEIILLARDINEEVDKANIKFLEKECKQEPRAFEALLYREFDADDPDLGFLQEWPGRWCLLEDVPEHRVLPIASSRIVITRDDLFDSFAALGGLSSVGGGV